jgi:transcriptional regulator GlxA family with amidase domain
MTVVFAPGGTYGTIAAASDAATLEFLRSRAERARCVTSVCTGSLILGAAGLLEGKKATSHWVVRDTLARFGAVPTDQRVVVDGKLITGAGVSAGLDFALAVVEILRGRPYAAALMLQAEYAPQPPFAGGTPGLTDPHIANPMRDMFTAFVAEAEALAKSRSPG